MMIQIVYKNIIVNTLISIEEDSTSENTYKLSEGELVGLLVKLEFIKNELY
jgi:hypothetical protein